ncbi:hypothetical protein HAX54_052532 [Datura stramonium]|uniref:Uncharacterized protein n=1 Tax=Datura stramonium TaxID=4076 RepID=A0ABS8SZS8_DATST|nr:hypothetical protein [Datura stramonium]
MKGLGRGTGTGVAWPGAMRKPIPAFSVMTCNKFGAGNTASRRGRFQAKICTGQWVDLTHGNVLKRARVKKGQSFGFGGLMTRFMCGHQIEEEEVDYRPVYDPRDIEVTKTKEPEGIHGPILYINEHNARIDNMLSHIYGMQMLQLRMNGVTEEQLQ